MKVTRDQLVLVREASVWGLAVVHKRSQPRDRFFCLRSRFIQREPGLKNDIRIVVERLRRTAIITDRTMTAIELITSLVAAWLVYTVLKVRSFKRKNVPIFASRP